MKLAPNPRSCERCHGRIARLALDNKPLCLVCLPAVLGAMGFPVVAAELRDAARLEAVAR